MKNRVYNIALVTLLAANVAVYAHLGHPWIAGIAGVAAGAWFAVTRDEWNQ